MAAKGKRFVKASCVYCGVKTPRQPRPGWPPVCRLHADLPENDPNYPDISAADDSDTLRA